MLRLGVLRKESSIRFDTSGWVAVWPSGRWVPRGHLDVTKRTSSSYLMPISRQRGVRSVVCSLDDFRVVS